MICLIDVLDYHNCLLYLPFNLPVVICLEKLCDNIYMSSLGIAD